MPTNGHRGEPPKLPPRAGEVPDKVNLDDMAGLEEGGNQGPPPEAVASYTDADLEASYAYLRELILGDAAQASRLAPPNFNELCRDPTFAALVKERADELRRESRA